MFLSYHHWLKKEHLAMKISVLLDSVVRLNYRSVDNEIEFGDLV